MSVKGLHKGIETEHVVEVYTREGSIGKTARALDVHRKTVQYHLKKAGVTKPLAAGLKRGLPHRSPRFLRRARSRDTS